MDILSITNKESVSADAKVYTKDGNDFVTTTFDALYKNSSAKTNIEKSVSDANARIDNTNNTVAELDNYARAKANGIVLQSQGEMVTVNDSSDDYVVNLKPYGKSEQDSTTGAQLLDMSDAVGGNSAGVTVDVNDDGTYTINGSNDSAVINVWLKGGWGATTPVLTLPAGTYSFKDIALFKGMNQLSSPFTSTEEILITGVRCMGLEIGTYNNKIMYPMLNAGSTALPWEPYTGGKSSPKPDYPQEIRSTVISEIKTIGKNWLKNTATSQTVSGVGIVVNEDKSITVNGTATETISIMINENTVLEDGELYTLSGCPSGGSGSTYKLDTISVGATSKIYGVDTGNSATFKYTKEDSSSCVSRIVIYSGATLNNLTFYPMIRKADITDAIYEPYTETAAQLSEPITLYGIATTSGGNFTDSNGQQWIVDYIDTAKGKVVRNVVKLNVYDETVYDWGAESYGHDFYIPHEQYDTTNYIARTIPAICNKLSYTEERIAPSFYYRTHNMGWDGYARIGFRVPSDVNTVDLFKEYLGENCEIILPLKDPTVEDLPTADVVALKNLKIFYNITHVMNDSEVKGEMVLSYNADTKMYIDNKFAELAAQLV